MKPCIQKITIDDNWNKVITFIQEMIMGPKKTIKQWSEITRQTPSVKLGYIGQHLASIITGVQGSGSGARGADLCDGTEVKSCNKIDQLDKCKGCGNRVLRFESICPSCGSNNIERKNDSKWLFSIRSKHELDQLKSLNRILLILMDYPGFKENNFNDIRISAYEIYPKEPRCEVFNKLIENHYYNIYLPKINKKGKANPMNLHPFGYQFYKCNPTKIFQCTVQEIDNDGNCKINLDYYLEPTKERVESCDMPTDLLKNKEWESLNFDKIKLKYNIPINKVNFYKLPKNKKVEMVPFLDEDSRSDLPLREIVSSEQHSEYKR